MTALNWCNFLPSLPRLYRSPLLLPGCSCALVGAGPASLLAPLSSSSPSPSVDPCLSPSVTSPGSGWLAGCGLVSANSCIFWRTPQEAATSLYSAAPMSLMGSLCWCCEKERVSLCASKLGWCGGGMKSQRMSSSSVSAACCWLRKQQCLALIWAWAGYQMPLWGSCSCSVSCCLDSGSFCCSVS